MVVGRLWDMLPIPVDALPDAELLEASALLIESGLVRVQGGVLAPVSLEEQLGQIVAWVMERNLRRVLEPPATGGAVETDVDVTE